MCYRISNLPLAFYGLLLFAILITPQKAKAQEWSEPVYITTPYDMIYISQSDMIIDKNGVLHIVWVQRFGSTTNSFLVYIKSINQGRDWTEPITLTLGIGYLIYNPILALYSDNTVLLSYFSLKTEVEQSRIFLKKLEGDIWGDEIAVNGSHDYRYWLRTHCLAIDSNDKAYILWPKADLSCTLIVTYFNNQFSTIVQGPTDNVKRFTTGKAIFDKNDVLHYSGFRGNTIGYSYYSSGQWLPFNLVDDSYKYHDFTLDKESIPYFVLNSVIDGGSTMFGNYYRNRWYFEKIASGYSESHSLFIEQNGTKHIAGSWGNSLKYYRNNNDGWTDTLLESRYSIYNKLLAKDSLLYLLSNIRINNERTYLEIRKMAIENQVGIQEQPQLVNKKINIYPNPANETVNINFFSPEGQATIKIIDLQGKQIFSTTVKNSNMGIFDFQWNRMCAKGNAATTGIYFVVIQAGEQVFAEKVVLF
ncbi:MAG TPA: T9SS type A sorting domain-containing protein [Salinivirgaceae bacterium]|nr:T9SS type A sorting domain-containing protein [Salinivirgaceae bacterium]